MRLSLVGLAVVLGGAVVSMGVFAMRGSRRDRDASAKGSRLALGLGDFLVHWFMWVLGPVERGLVRGGVRPETLNYAGLVCGAASGPASSARVG
jgi:hypothetical protein